MSLSDKYTVVGVMSGTSLDGLDLVICEFSTINQQLTYKIRKAETIPYDAVQKNKLRTTPYLNVENYFLLHYQFGKFIGKQARRLFDSAGIKPNAIASHGHTIFHQPQKGYSTQIGCGATIAAESGITTVCDFRSLDVALNGQGAPLVPIGDKLLFGKYDSCLNLGGIANISFDNSNEKRVAFDITVVNMALNFFSEKLGFEYDKDGELAKQGNFNSELFNALNDLPFYKQSNAKSIGREWFENDFMRVIEEFKLTNYDLLNTITHHSAYQIADVLNKNQLKNVFITGGGAFNSFFIEKLSDYYKGEIIIPEAEIVNFKEALIFAFLGYLRLTHQINTLSSVTGAKFNSVGGAVYLMES